MRVIGGVIDGFGCLALVLAVVQTVNAAWRGVQDDPSPRRYGEPSGQELKWTWLNAGALLGIGAVLSSFPA